MNYLPTLEMLSVPDSKPVASIIWLHGLGADGNDFAGIVPELKLPSSLPVRFVFPHAPAIPVTINNGYIMPAWYDIVEIDVKRRVDEEQLTKSAAAVHALIDREVERGVESGRIIVAGFSQGGAVVIHAALTSSRPLGGLLVLSSYFPTAGTIQPKSANVQLPVLVCHGRHDPVVNESLGQLAEQNLKALGHQTRYLNYPMEHSVCLEEIRDISNWIQEVLA